MESFLFIAKIEKGIAQADAGKTLSHRRVKAKMRKWLKAKHLDPSRLR